MSDPASDPPDKALPLCEAIRRFVSDDLWHDFEAARAERRMLPHRTQRHSSWIDGGRAERANLAANQVRLADAKMRRAWAVIKRVLIEKLITGELIAFAQSEPPFGYWRSLPMATWRNLRIKDVRNGSVTGPGIELAGLHVKERTADGALSARTGLPGRTSESKHFIEAEFARRVASGKLEPSLVRQSVVLLDWFRINHPDKPAPTPKTIENNMRKPYRDAIGHVRKP
jgi:hypothetical protein